MVLLSPDELMDERIFDYIHCRQTAEEKEWELKIRYEEFLQQELSEIPHWRD